MCNRVAIGAERNEILLWIHNIICTKPAEGHHVMHMNVAISQWTIYLPEVQSTCKTGTSVNCKSRRPVSPVSFITIDLDVLDSTFRKTFNFLSFHCFDWKQA